MKHGLPVQPPAADVRPARRPVLLGPIGVILTIATFFYFFL